jgi:uncharacterized protein (DUF952 family)
VLTYHLVPREAFDPDAAEYRPEDLEHEGFVHTTRDPALLAAVGNRYYRGDPRPYLVLTIDLARVRAPWRYDAAGEDYPHVYGPLNREAIVAVHPAPRATDGTFTTAR